MILEALSPRWGQESPKAESRQESETQENSGGRLTKISIG